MKSKVGQNVPFVGVFVWVFFISTFESKTLTYAVVTKPPSRFDHKFDLYDVNIYIQSQYTRST